MKKTKTIAAFIMAVVIMAVIVSSALFIAVKSEHNCTGEDCTVCASISVCKDKLKTFSSGTVFENTISLGIFFILINIIIYVITKFFDTPVSLKVKLLN